ncbi:MAG TPA: methyltransferase domain-containing protein [Thermoplasmatales archaeon]|nr:methyltransferase domain-containing protein [Thermoplasmatales archaeon]
MNKRYLHNRLVRFVEKLLENSRLLTDFYIRFFRKMTVDEFSRVPLPKDARVLIIGCGSIPHTAIIVAKEKPWKVVGVDRDNEAVQKARSLVERYGLGDRVRVVEGDGLSFDLSGYDLVVVAHGVEPKSRILERIVEEMDGKTTVLFRTTWDFLDVVYGDERVPEGLYVVDVFKRPDFIKSVFMRKR